MTFAKKAAVAIVCLLTTFMASMTSADTSFGFLVEPRDTTAVQGETVTLYCSLNRLADTFMWVRDTVVISQSLQIVANNPGSRYSIFYDGTSYNLIISGVEPDDVGNYKCVAFSDGTGILSRSAELEVHAAPSEEYPTITSTVTGLIAVGETIEIVCELDGGYPIPEIELIKDDEVLVVASGRLVYAWVTDENDDGAVVECRARHPLWTDTRSSFVGPFRLVVDPPQVLLAPSFEEVEAGSVTSFICSASSAPRGSYHWFINGVEQHSGEDIVIDTTASANILRIRGSRQNAGIVRCTVRAANGEATAEATLVVIVHDESSRAPTSEVEPTDVSTTKTSTKGVVTTPTLLPEETNAPSTTTPAQVQRETGTPTTPSPPLRETSTATTPRSSTHSRRETTRQTGSTTATATQQQHDTSMPASESVATEVAERESTETATEVDATEPPVRGASSFNTIFVASVSTIATLIGIIFIVALGAFCVVTVRRARQQDQAGKKGAEGDGNVYFRSRYVSVMRSWLFPVHRDTQKTLTSFENPSPDESPYNTINSRR
ncbi:immunoglobulin superfamily DCC subclass member 4-like [Diadema setosum]|uniref:immunoglobulin superfamily DCC subclass member 4-like n=1 Tax=Diadema setosum TaxID=31175 RepID=UPI003B3B1E68